MYVLYTLTISFLGQVVASVIMKLCGGSGDKSAYKEELNVDTFLSQVTLHCCSVFVYIYECT